MTAQRKIQSTPQGHEALQVVELAYSRTRQPLGFVELQKAREQVIEHANALSSPAWRDYWVGRIALDSAENPMAKALLERAAQTLVNAPEVYFQLGHAYLANKEFKAALDAFANAVNLNSTATRADFGMGFTLMQMGRMVEAFGIMRRVIRRFPDDGAVRATLFKLLRFIRPDHDDTGLASDALWWLNFNDAPFDDLGNFIGALLLHRYKSRPLVNVMATDSLLLTALAKTHFASGELELLLRQTRRTIFVSALADNHISEEGLKLALALFQQSRLNEGVWSYSDDEATLLNNLEHLITQAHQAGMMKGDVCPLIVLFGMYKPALASKLVPQLAQLEGSWPSWAHRVMEQITDEAQHLIRSQQSIAPNDVLGDITCRVQQQYEKWPYPRWQHLDWSEQIPFAEAIKRTFKLAEIPSCLSLSPMPVLIAGCGTGRHALHVAKGFSDTQVTAIDISRASLGWAKMKAEQYELNNVEFKQLDIMQLEQLDQQFALVECSGVLHHMASAEAGLAKLRDKLLPQGMLKVAVYSREARKQIIALREQLSFINCSAEAIRQQRDDILSEQTEEKWAGIADSRDFYSLSGTKDLLFNEHEVQFTVAELIDMVKRHDLQPIGLVLDTTMQRNWLNHFGTLPDPTDFERWAELEQAIPNTFNNMIQLYCQASD
ncbi:class I SAM-dependent methyltransferase [Salinibius halmophilus]|uniref:class I SAM-dependent methyltransferase n=1 Tax=Salinibius halmophilus TaxID=1853216 RepID=UPI000E66B547|nr:class I SAM-dependent methyltransferase [Salinibius halmophilus]